MSSGKIIFFCIDDLYFHTLTETGEQRAVKKSEIRPRSKPLKMGLASQVL